MSALDLIGQVDSVGKRCLVGGLGQCQCQCQFRRSEGSTALGLQIDDLASSRQDLAVAGR